MWNHPQMIARIHVDRDDASDGTLEQIGNAGQRIIWNRLWRRRARTTSHGPCRQCLAGHLRVIAFTGWRKNRWRTPAGGSDEDHARRRVRRWRPGDVGAATPTRAEVRGTFPFRIAAMRRRHEQGGEQVPLARALQRELANLRREINQVFFPPALQIEWRGSGRMRLRRRQLLAGHFRLRRGPIDDGPDWLPCVPVV